MKSRSEACLEACRETRTVSNSTYCLKEEWKLRASSQARLESPTSTTEPIALASRNRCISSSCSSAGDFLSLRCCLLAVGILERKAETACSAASSNPADRRHGAEGATWCALWRTVSPWSSCTSAFAASAEGWRYGLTGVLLRWDVAAIPGAPKDLHMADGRRGPAGIEELGALCGGACLGEGNAVVPPIRGVAAIWPRPLGPRALV